MGSETHKILVDQELNYKILDLLRSARSRLRTKAQAEEIALLCISELNKARDLIAEFESSPKFLDTCLNEHVDELSQLYLSVEARSPIASAISSCLYQLCLVRGYKQVGSCLSSEVSIGPKLINNIKSAEVGQFEAYALLLWLSSFAMLPFSLDTIFPDLHSVLYNLALEFLAKYGGASRTQKMSAVLLSRVLTRADSEAFLSSYFETCFDHWQEWTHTDKLGHLMTIKLILKQSSNTTLSGLADDIYDKIVLQDLLLIKYGLDTLVPNTNIAHLMSVLSRLGKFYLLQASYSKLSGIVNNLINDILIPLAGRFDINLREALAKNLSELVSILRTKAVNFASQLVWYVTKQLKIPELDKYHTYYNPNVTISASNLSVAKVHTNLLFYGFLGLNRSIDADFIPILLSVTHKTLFVSSINFPVVQGSQIRDASCFCLWALFRSLPPNEFEHLCSNKTQVHDLWADILRVLLIDEDYAIRRCAASVLQEFVGRFGVLVASTLETASVTEASKLVERTSSLVDADRAVLTAKDMIRCGYPSSLFLPTLTEILASQDVSFSHYRRCTGLFIDFVNADYRQNEIEHAFEVSLANTQYDRALHESYQLGNVKSLLPLGELLRSGKLDPDIASKVYFDPQSISSHHLKFEHRLSYFFWCSSCIISQMDSNLKGLFWSLWISVVSNEASLKADYTSLIHDCMEAAGGLVIDDDVFEDLLKRLRYGSSLIAGQVPWENLSDDQADELISLIADKSVDCETRANLINNNPCLLGADGNYRLQFPFGELLDDYTITNKGDVGLKVRIACLKHYRQFLVHKPMDSGWRAKVVRLAGESIDSVRAVAFSALLGIDHDFEAAYLYDEYYSQLFGMYFSLEDSSKEAFWEGVVHSVAGIKSSKAIVNLSFRQLLQWLEKTLEEGRSEMFTILLRQLKLPKPFVQLYQRTQKTILATLNLFVKLFEANLRFPQDFNYNALFVRTYNLQLNAPSSRSALALSIFQYLSVVPSEISPKARQRLSQIYLQTKAAQIRRLAQEAIFEVINDLAPENSSLLEFVAEDYKPTPKSHKIFEQQLMSI